MYPYQTYKKTNAYAQPSIPVQTPVIYPGQNPYPYIQPPTTISQPACLGSNCCCCQPCEAIIKENIYQQPPTYVLPTPFVVQQTVYQQPGYGYGAAGSVYGQACCYGQHRCHDCC